jgi:hypothetical protein
VSPELENKLIEKYSKIFRDASKSPQETCMCWGLEVGDGWYNLIDTLCEALTYSFTTSVQIDEEDGKRLGIEGYKFKDEPVKYYFSVEPPQVIADQVKEKFGTLRFYYHLEYDEKNTDLVKTGKYPDLDQINKRYQDYFDGVIHFADIASARICSASGDVGKLHVRGGWVKVLNEELAKQSPKFEGYKPYVNKQEDSNET